MCVKARDKCNKILEECQKLGFQNEIAEGKLRNIIMNVRDIADDRSVNNWINALVAFDFMEWKSPHVYRINRKET